jgi:hypothetical protein
METLPTIAAFQMIILTMKAFLTHAKIAKLEHVTPTTVQR